MHKGLGAVRGVEAGRVMCMWSGGAQPSQRYSGSPQRLLAADVTSGVNTREKLKRKDPELASILATVFGDGPWRYPLTAPQPFGPCSPPPAAPRSSPLACMQAAAAGAGAAQGGGTRAAGGAGPARTPDRPVHRAMRSGGGAKDLEGGMGLELESVVTVMVEPMRREGKAGRGGGGGGDAAPRLVAAACRGWCWRLAGRLASCCRCCTCCHCCSLLCGQLSALTVAEAGEDLQVPLRQDGAGQQELASTPTKSRRALLKMLSLMRRAGLRSPRVPNSPKGQ
jgi:hypothetical protein